MHAASRPHPHITGVQSILSHWKGDFSPSWGGERGISTPFRFLHAPQINKEGLRIIKRKDFVFGNRSVLQEGGRTDTKSQLSLCPQKLSLPDWLEMSSPTPPTCCSDLKASSYLHTSPSSKREFQLLFSFSPKENKTLPLRGGVFPAVYLEWHRWFPSPHPLKQKRKYFMQKAFVRNQEHFRCFTPHVETEGSFFCMLIKEGKGKQCLMLLRFPAHSHVEELGPV